MGWMTLASGVVGADIATASAVVFDKQRWRRERQDRAAAVRREIYGECLSCLSAARNAFRGLAQNSLRRLSAP